jgi:hypothetical protein
MKNNYMHGDTFAGLIAAAILLALVFSAGLAVGWRFAERDCPRPYISTSCMDGLTECNHQLSWCVGLLVKRGGKGQPNGQ